MTTIEKIRAEIDKLYDEYKDKFLKYRDSYHLGLFDGLEMAKRVLDTLEEAVSVPPTGISVPVQDVSVPPGEEEEPEYYQHFDPDC